MKVDFFSPQQCDGAHRYLPVVGPVNGADTEMPYIGTLRTGLTVVGAIPSGVEVFGGVDQKSLAVIDGKFGLEGAIANRSKAVVDVGSRCEDIGDEYGGEDDGDGLPGGVEAIPVVDSKDDGDAVEVEGYVISDAS